MPRRGHKGTLDIPTPDGYSYIIDGRGEIVLNEDGESVKSYMHSVCWNAFRYDLLTVWDQIDRERKDYVVSLIKEEFPQPNRDAEFNTEWMIQQMRNLMGHRRSEARDRYKEGKPRPHWCEEDIWDLIKQERDGNPNLFQQQVQARAAQSSSQVSHLGSGGKSGFLRDFVGLFIRTI